MYGRPTAVAEKYSLSVHGTIRRRYGLVMFGCSTPTVSPEELEVLAQDL